MSTVNGKRVRTEDDNECQTYLRNCTKEERLEYNAIKGVGATGRKKAKRLAWKEATLKHGTAKQEQVDSETNADFKTGKYLNLWSIA